jgi:very-short-patch-repair endonuclease
MRGCLKKGGHKMQTRFNKALLNGTLLARSRQMRSEATDAERKLWQNLRRGNLGVKFKRQYTARGYIVDFCCPQRRLVIELDGGQHAENVEYDQRRSSILGKDGFTVLRFWNTDVLENIDGVLESIIQALQQPPSPQPSPMEEGERG